LVEGTEEAAVVWVVGTSVVLATTTTVPRSPAAHFRLVMGK
jgi:hypothetical protein